ncbi:MAG: molybdenum cofactor guanylyltransferase [Bacteroidota bacterium]
MNISAAILAGGKGSRMGNIRKEFISFEGTTLLGRMFEVLRPVFAEILLVSNEDQKLYNGFGIDKIVPDTFPGKGPLAGIHAALINTTGYVFIFACDLPKLDIAFILQQIRQLHAGQDALVPRHKNGIEPLHAIYSQSCVEPAAKVLSQNNHPAIREMLDLVNTRYWDIPKNDSFANINSIDDLTKWERRMIPKQ